VLLGTPAADSLYGLAGSDRLRGGAGPDLLDGGPGSDDLTGGPGRDAVVYAGPVPVAVTLDDLANDGGDGERDNVQTDVEDVYGGAGADRLRGSAGDEALDGGAGDDLVDGRGGEDGLFAGDGDDRVEARDGARDAVECGPGDDIAIVDEQDRATGCEVIDRRPAEPHVEATVTYEWREVGPRTAYPRLEVTDLDPAAAVAEVRCSGGGCPFARRRVTRPRGDRLTRIVAGVRAAHGGRLELRLTAAGHVGKLIRFEARRFRDPRRRDLCLRGRAQRPSRRCP
jgi:hypothetical protein